MNRVRTTLAPMNRTAQRLRIRPSFVFSAKIILPSLADLPDYLEEPEHEGRTHAALALTMLGGWGDEVRPARSGGVRTRDDPNLTTEAV